jgi:predicted RNA polymerase sigma factor
MAAARNKALDHLRQQALHARKQEELGADADARGDHVVPDFVDGLDAQHAAQQFGDDVLRLIFSACHPVLPRQAQTALALKPIGGLSTEEIARLRRARADHRAAHRARQEDPRPGARALRVAAR